MKTSSPTVAAGGLSITRVLTVLVIAEIVSAFEASMIYSALPRFYGLFDDPLRIGWLLTAFLLVSAASAALCGRLGDLYGRRRVLLVILALSGVGALVSALSTSLEGIIAGRAIQGASGAILPLCFGLAREHLRPSKVAFGVGVVGGAASVGAGLGFMIGGILVDHFSWAWIFHASAILAAIAGVLVFTLLPASATRPVSGRIDLVGGILFVPALTGILLGLTVSRQWGWTSPGTLGLIFGGALLLALWVRHELHHSSPLIDVRLLARREVALANIAFAMLALGAMHVAQVLMVLLQQPLWTGVGLGITATLAGSLKFPSVLLAMLAAPWGGRMAERHDGRYALVAGTLITFAAWVGLALFHHSVFVVIALMLLSAAGMTVCFGAVGNVIVEAVPSDRTSEATGMVQVSRAASMAVGSQIVALLMASSTVSTPGQKGVFPSAQAYNLTMGYIALACGLALLAAWALPRRQAAGADKNSDPTRAAATP